METRNFGSSVRGGGNSHARFFLHVLPQDDGVQKSHEEMDAIFSTWDEEFSLKGENWVGRCYALNTRREFALVPAVIRKSERLGYDVATSMWDEGIKGKVLLSQDPASFWKVLAMAQTFYRD